MKPPNQQAIPCFLSVLGLEGENYAVSSENIVKPTYEHILQTPVSSLNVPIDEIIKHARSYPQYHSQYQSPPDAGTSVNELFCILNDCVKLELKEEASKVLKTGLPNLLTLQPNFWGQWKAMFYFTQDLIMAVQAHDDEHLNEICKPFITHVLQQSSRFLASSRPQKPRNWSRPQKVRPSYSSQPLKICTCEPCRAAKLFLINPTQRVGRFSYAKQLRSHMEYECFDSTDFKFETDKSRSPHTLVVYKTDNKYTRDLANWHADVKEMRSKQVEMRSEFLTGVLGSDAAAIAGLDNALVAAGTAEGVQMGPQALQPTSANAQNRAPFAPHKLLMKTDMEVVDLTED